MDYLHEGLSHLNLDSIPGLEQDLCTYIHELELFNSAYDLVGADTRDDIIIRHVLDSLSAVHAIRELAAQFAQETGRPPRIADVGSGGGLPGIPLSLAMRDTQFTLIERMTKRCNFLENCRAVLNLSNVSVLCEQAERVPQQSVDIAVFRAFRPLDRKMARVLMRIVSPQGYLAAYKAKLEKITEEMNGIAPQIPEYRTIPLTVPFLNEDGSYERNLVVVKKAGN